MSTESTPLRPAPPSAGVQWCHLVMALVPLGVSLVVARQVSATIASWTIALSGFALSLLACHLSLRWQRVRWRQLGLRRPEAWMRLIILVPTGVVALIVLTSIGSSILDATLGWKPDLRQFDVIRGNSLALAGGLVVVWTVAAFGEEMLWRGFLMNGVHRALFGPRAEGGSKWIAPLVVTSLICGLAHAYQGPAGMVLTGLIGLGFGLVYVLAHCNLWASILTHGIYDTIGLVVVFLDLVPT